MLDLTIIGHDINICTLLIKRTLDVKTPKSNMHEYKCLAEVDCVAMSNSHSSAVGTESPVTAYCQRDYNKTRE